MIKIAIVSEDEEYLDHLKRREDTGDYEYHYFTNIDDFFDSKEDYNLVLVDDAIRDLTFDETVDFMDSNLLLAPDAIELKNLPILSFLFHFQLI